MKVTGELTVQRMEENNNRSEVKEALFEKWQGKYEGKLEQISEELQKKSFDSSNLENAVEKCLSIAENLSGTWVSMNYEEKQRLQYLVFPEGVVYSKEKGVVRTERVNALFAEILLQKRVLAEKKKGNSEKNCLKSYSVPRTGIEPALSFENQILSLARLPIPPSGLLGGSQYYDFPCN